MKFVGLVNNARDPLVCAVQKKSQQSRLKKKKKNKQTNADGDMGLWEAQTRFPNAHIHLWEGFALGF